MKVIVIGPSLSGKTTVIRQLCLITEIPVFEMDEELTKLNKGSYPTESEYKQKALAPKVIDRILNKENIIFFTNTDYFSVDDLVTAKLKGFEIIQLVLDFEKLMKRNEQRVKNEGYEDLSKWFRGMLKYQEILREKGLVDKIIQADQPVTNIVKEILKTLS